MALNDMGYLARGGNNFGTLVHYLLLYCFLMTITPPIQSFARSHEGKL